MWLIIFFYDIANHKVEEGDRRQKEGKFSYDASVVVFNFFNLTCIISYFVEEGRNIHEWYSVRL